MSDLKTASPNATSYRICRTENKEHLNGVITLIDFGDNTGIAVVYVSESRSEEPDPVWHVSTEFIVGNSTNNHWHTRQPHTRHNGDKQHWYFKKITSRNDGPPRVIDSDGGDNGKHYTTYIKYDLFSVGEEPWSIKKREKQGDGTGTGGNGETGDQ